MSKKSTKHQVRSADELRGLSLSMSERIIEITSTAGSGHPSSSLSAIDILTCLYFRPIMNYDPARPNWSERDRFILSKGHGAPGLYTALAWAGYFDKSLLDTLRQFGSPLEGHPNMRLVDGVEASTGSLGQGLSIGIGHALAGKLDKKDFRVYVMIGDGEMQEGQIWEGVMFAASKRIDNLTVIVDYNQYQQTGAVNQIMPALYPPGEKWGAFGWYAEEIDGHDMEQIIESLEKASQVQGKPQVIVAKTSKGKYLDAFTSDKVSHMHGKPLKPEDVKAAIKQLKENFNKQKG